MKNPMFPENYAEWQHFITVECKIDLTPKFVEERLAVWRDENCEETRRFRRLYGDAYWRSIITWFEQAQSELVENA